MTTLSTPQTSFNIPTNLYPFTLSNSFSGMNWEDPFAKSMLGSLTTATNNLPGLVEGLPGALQSMYGNFMRQGLGPQAFQGTLNNLASRNVLNSSVASDALNRARSTVANQVAQQAYPSFLKGLMTQIELPNLLGRLASVGKVATAQSQSGNPLAPYEDMIRLLTSQ